MSSASASANASSASASLATRVTSARSAQESTASSKSVILVGAAAYSEEGLRKLGREWEKAKPGTVKLVDMSISLQGSDGNDLMSEMRVWKAWKPLSAIGLDSLPGKTGTCTTNEGDRIEVESLSAPNSVETEPAKTTEQYEVSPSALSANPNAEIWMYKFHVLEKTPEGGCKPWIEALIDCGEQGGFEKTLKELKAKLLERVESKGPDKQGPFVCTNHFLDPELKVLEKTVNQWTAELSKMEDGLQALVENREELEKKRSSRQSSLSVMKDGEQGYKERIRILKGRLKKLERVRTVLETTLRPLAR